MSLAGEERKERIVDWLNYAGKVRTSDLVTKLKVSSETIRRYLEELEHDKKLKRVYGGAIKVQYDQEEPPHLTREVAFADEKKRIARTAAQLVQDNDVVLIDDGTTTMHMLPHLLGRKNLCFITISVPALNLLMDYQNKGLLQAEAYFIGGKIQPKHFRSVGTLAEKMMQDFFVDKSFLSIDGIQAQYGISSYDAEKAMLAKRFIENAKETIVLTDHSKIGISTFYKIADLKETDVVVSDVPSPEEWSRELEAKNVNWIVAQ
ncbi:DeoR/GlpR family DNA-binding transcription regulator [Brevibacillus centrosporus]|jgi:DeoR/GlpR family transcriptional regulator of sugar metabolism|uniref:DeoR/GlpR family DNA-binding transcription regulator n=1 Tax=Brevibacillus centrosporus TaxID=54910 RepID=UPI002E1D946B|nr:DeoR/GlpR family DNA-binding transcription regulator [Brevibacillus centrosporus]